LAKPFDYVNEVLLKKNDIIRNSCNPDGEEDEYNAFLMNRALSFYPDTIMYAEQMNENYWLDKIMQNDYLLNIIRAKKREHFWAKKQEEEDISLVQQYYKVNRNVACDYLSVLSRENIDEIGKRI